MRSHLKIFYLIFTMSVSVFAQNTNKDVALSTNVSSLNINNEGILKITENKTGKAILCTSIGNLWQLTIQNKKESALLTPKVYSVTASQKAEVQKSGADILIIYTGFKAGNTSLPIGATFKITVRDNAYVFTVELHSTLKEWEFRELAYPIFNDITADAQNSKVYWPNGLGQCFESPRVFKEQVFNYPGGRGTMQWFSINTENQGLYIGSHDPERGKKQFKMAYNSQRATFSTELQFPVFAAHYVSPNIIVKPYIGTWHDAADSYRQWFNQSFKMPSIPDWVKKDSGWLLAVLKQQNGHVMWNYDNIEKLCYLAKERNLTTIGLFGWANGGHDNLFPNFIPDNLMGGKQALKEAIKKAHERGIRIILYANAFMFDVSTEYYRYNGNDVALMQEDQTPILMSVRKFFDFTPVIFAMASPSSAIWRKTMFDLAIQANELGADGILYDQMGVKDATLDFSKLHDNKLPQDAFTKYRVQMLNEIRTKMKYINPEFIIMTEATHDGVITEIDYHHGWGIGSALEPPRFAGDLHTFTSLFRYTFPELIETQRNINPVITRSEANFSAIFGLRHEIETRYDEDVNYLLNEILPDSTSYSNVTYVPPLYQKINEMPAKEATKYIHDLIDFENQNAEFFRYGTFIDEKGFKVNGKNIIAKGFLNGDRLGIVVWNTDEKEESAFSIEISGYDFGEAKEISSPKVSINSPLSENSIRLIVYTKVKN
jgi:hypothetical protein